MGIFSRFSLIILVVSSLVLVQTKVVGNPNSGSGYAESTDIRWQRSKATTTELPTLPPIKASICPQNATILPCTCIPVSKSSGIIIECWGSAVDQRSIENSFREVRRVNGIPEDRGVHISEFRVWETELTQLDLAPLYGSRMDIFHTNQNWNLTKFLTSGFTQDQRSISVGNFYLFSSNVSVDEFGEIFKYFSVQMSSFTAYNLDLNLNLNNNNNVDEGEFEFEFLPGLSAFKNLTGLSLDLCNISGGLSSSHLQAFPWLQEISLAFNRIDGVGENVFPSNVSRIDLTGNQLNETSFHPESGIAHNPTGSGGRKTLVLWSNQLTTLPSQIFGTFLDAHPENTLYLVTDVGFDL